MKGRIINKYRKIKKERGLIIALPKTALYILRNLINNSLIYFLKQTTISLENKNILFIEPVNQGYGDLFFQTALLESLKKEGYRISILINKEHAPIIENNDMYKIYYWRLRDILSLTKSENIFIGLGRDTLRETVLLIMAKKRIILDKEIEKWKKTFTDSPNTIAWIKIFEYYLKINLENHQFMPRIIFSDQEKKYIRQNKSDDKLGIIYGIQNKTKRYDKIDRIIDQIPSKYKIILLGVETKYFGKKIVCNLTGIGYRKTILEIATCKTVMGTEGSLVHISSSLPIKTCVIDDNDRFTKNAHPELVKNVIILKSRDILSGHLYNII